MEVRSSFYKVKEIFLEHQERSWRFLVLGLSGLALFGLGLLVKQNQVSPLIIDQNIKTQVLKSKENNLGLNREKIPPDSLNQEGYLWMASINGSAYFPLDCFSAKRIKKENQIFFKTEKEAQDRGFKRSLTCND